MSVAAHGHGEAAASRRHLILDVGLAVALAAFVILVTSVASHQQPGRRDLDIGGVALVVAAVSAMPLRRRHPVPALVWVFGALVAYFGLGYPNGPIWLALIVVFFGAVARGHRLGAAIVALTGLAVFPWLDYALRDGPAPSPLAMIAVASWLLILFGAGEAVRINRQRAAEALRIREEEALRRASEERLRIARELHDALGHHLSLINVQSGVALHLGEELPESARSSMAAIKEASKEALVELRSVLAILRQEGEPAPRSPSSTLHRLGDLVSQAAAAGLEVRTETEGEVRPLPFGVDAAAFRIVQEALTNVARHAGAATAQVRLSYGEDDLIVQVDDDGRGPAPRAAEGGKGILGMRERATTLGGELDAGPRPGGGFRVRARLPLDGEA